MKRPPRNLEDLLQELDSPRELPDLLNKIMEEESKRQYLLKQRRKQAIIEEIVDASRIYEKMPLNRLCIKLKVEANVVLDILEELILAHEIEGVKISGDEIIFKKVPNLNQLNKRTTHKLLHETNGEIPAFSGYIKQTDQKIGEGETPVNVKLRLEPRGSEAVLQLEIANQSDYNLKNVEVRFLPSGNLKLSRIEPDYPLHGEWKNEFDIPHIPRKNTRRVIFHFFPRRCEAYDVGILVQFKNGEDFVEIFKNERNIVRKIDVLPPEPLDDDALMERIQKHLIFKGSRHLSNPGFAPGDLIELVTRFMTASNFQVAGEREDCGDQEMLRWFLGRTRGENDLIEEMVVLFHVDGCKIDIYVMASAEYLVLTVMTKVIQDLHKQLEKEGKIEENTYLVDLSCASCGATLHHCPEPGEIYSCEICGARILF